VSAAVFSGKLTLYYTALKLIACVTLLRKTADEIEIKFLLLLQSKENK
jgi:hypothetical protein